MIKTAFGFGNYKLTNVQPRRSARA